MVDFGRDEFDEIRKDATFAYDRLCDLSRAQEQWAESDPNPDALHDDLIEALRLARENFLTALLYLDRASEFLIEKAP
jgi:hypothetical protein